MKTITTLVVVLIISIFIVFSKPKNIITTKADIPSLDNNIHPYSIDSFRAMQFSPQSLIVERSVTPNSSVVSYLSENYKQYALMITPRGNPPSGGWPVVIVNHGHIPPEQYSVTRSYINTSNYFASQGFLVLKPDYRGHDQSQGQSSSRLLARSEYTLDVLNLLSAISSIPNANPDKIFMYGHSMGGEVTLQVLESTNKITAATLWAPSVTTLPTQVVHFIAKNKSEPDPAGAFQSLYDEFVKKYNPSQISSIENLDKISTPLNIHHSPTDEIVPYQWGVELNDKLKSMGKQVNFYSYPGDNHDIAKNFGKVLSLDATFFKSFL